MLLFSQMEPPTNEDISHLTNTNLLFVGLLVLDVVLMFHPTEMMSPKLVGLSGSFRANASTRLSTFGGCGREVGWAGSPDLDCWWGFLEVKHHVMGRNHTIPHNTIYFTLFYNTLYGGDEHPLLVETLFLGSPGYRVQQYHDSSPSQQRTAGSLQTAGPKPRMGKSWHH